MAEMKGTVTAAHDTMTAFRHGEMAEVAPEVLDEAELRGIGEVLVRHRRLYQVATLMSSPFRP